MAVVIDGAYFLHRFANSFPDHDAGDPEHVARCLLALVNWHLTLRTASSREPADVAQASRKPWYRPGDSLEVYRIFFYDCPPLTKKVHRPVSKRSLDLAKTDTAKARIAIHQRLSRVRKVALRLGRLNDEIAWQLQPGSLKRLLADPVGFVPTDDDFSISTVQKGVDMRLGLDVAAMAFKEQVDQIILVAGDGDFVPAAKLARREGIDVVVDTMGGNVAADLLDHTDGYRSCRRPPPLYTPDHQP